MGKTDTIKDRRVDVYVDTIARKQRWTEHAEDAGESLSSFVERCVESTIEKGGPDFQELAAEGMQVRELEEEIVDLRSELEKKEVIIETLASQIEEMDR